MGQLAARAGRKSFFIPCEINRYGTINARGFDNCLAQRNLLSSVARPFHIVHITPSFGLGGAQIRTVQLMNYLGTRFRHTVVALDSDIRAAHGISGNDVDIRFAKCMKTRNTFRGVAQLYALLTREKPDLVLTYNWGSMDGVTAGIISRLPIIHIEDGFGDGEATRQKIRRVWYRRAVLRGVRAVVSPSQTLVKIMRKDWKLHELHVKYIPNGVDVDKFTPAAAEERIRDAVVIGTVGQLRPEKRQDRLMEACAALATTRNIRLILAGDGPQRAALEEQARTLNLSSRVDFTGHILEPRNLYRQFDIFTLSSSTEQMPLSVLEAMACGLPILSTDVGDIRTMVSPGNRKFVTDWSGYEAGLKRLTTDPHLREELGGENRKRCAKEYSLGRMLKEYEKLFEQTVALHRAN
jgi:glycosyltransferase involved in cell wall biosynthesis